MENNSKNMKLNFEKTDFSVSLELCPNRHLDFELLEKISPNFCSVTWHTQQLPSTFDQIPSLVLIKKISLLKLNVLMHLTGKNFDKKSIKRILDEAKGIGVKNILALQGDSPDSDNNKSDFPTASDLIKFVRKTYGDYFAIGVAGYPEMHPKSGNVDEDLGYLKNKILSGAEFVLTQVVFDYQILDNFANSCKRFGITTPIIPGVYIIESYESLKKMAQICQIKVPTEIMEVVTKNRDNPEAVRNYGMHQAIELIKTIQSKADRSLIKGVHLFCLNNMEMVEKILMGVGVNGVERSMTKEENRTKYELLNCCSLMPKEIMVFVTQNKDNPKTIKNYNIKQFKLAHQFWISYPPPGAGSSTSSKEKEKQQQAEEEKRNTTREQQRQLDYDAAVKEHHRSQREQWEIRQLDNDLLHQRHSEREREREEKELAEQQLLLADEHDEHHLQQMCRAPIASLDCMEEFSAGSALSALADRSIGAGGDGGGGGGGGGGGVGVVGGNITKEQLLLSGLTHSAPAAPLQLTRQTSVTPGLRYRNLGKSGLRVSNVGLGTWPTFSPNVTEEQAEQIIVLAVESGINVFDLSEAHSGTRAEVELGRILQRRGWKRTCFIVTTKIYWSTRSEERGLSRKHIIESVKASLVRLQLSYIDVVIVHKADPMCPMEEVVRAMHYVISQGWVMYWGTARWSPVEIMEAYTNCRQFNCVTPIVEQTEYHMFCREKTELYMPELYNKIGVGLMAWSPISMGLSQGKDDGSIQLFSRSSFRNKYSSFSWTEDETTAATNKDGYTWMKERIQPEESRRQSERIRELGTLAERLGCSLAQLAIAWCLKNESVQCLLIGASTVDQLYESIQSLQLVPKLNTNMVAEIERILENKPSRPPMVSTLALR